MKLFRPLTDLIFPPRCAACEKFSSDPLCPSCFAELAWIKEPLCQFCGKPALYEVERCRECRGKRFFFKSARSLWVYKGAVQKVIQAYKYQNHRLLAPRLAKYLAVLWPEQAEVITWVPLSWAKQVERGFNQARLLAVEMARLLEKESKNLLRRPRHTLDQNKLALEERHRNVKGAFALREGNIQGKSVVLIDDVFTTGATVSECAHVLRKGGAKEVHVLTLARTLRES